MASAAKAESAREIVRRRFPAAFARLAGAEPRRERAGWVGRARDPAALIRRWLAGLSIQEGSAIAFVGLREPEVFLALLGALPPGCSVYCAEQDAGALAAFLEWPEAAAALGDARVFLGVGEPDDAFFEPMERFPSLQARDVATALFAPTFQESEAYCSRFFLEFARRLDVWRKLWGTNAVWSGLWQENVFGNLGLLLGAPDIGAFRGAFAGKDLVLAAAGPSLDASLDLLRRIGDRAVIVAVNSSFRALRNAGVEPHFVLAADAFPDCDRGFESVDLGRTILLCPFIVFPAVARRFEGRVATWSGGNLLATYLRHRIGLPVGTRVVEEGTVSACAFDIAEAFGCRSLSFVGQDLAVRDDGRSHASDSFYEDAGGGRVDPNACRKAPGNTRETVLVESRLYVYLKTFERLARERAGRYALRNASPLGARVAGLPYCELSALEAALPAQDDPAIRDAWARLAAACAPERSRVEAARRELDRLASFAREVCRTALAGALALDPLAPGFGTAGAGEAVRRASALGLRLDDSGDPDAARFAVLKDGQLKRELLDRQRDLRSFAESSPDERARAAQETFFWALSEASFALAEAAGAADS